MSDEMPDEQKRQQLATELDQLIDRVRAAKPEYVPPPFSPQRLVEFLEKNLRRFSPQVAEDILKRLRSGIGEDIFDLDTWKGVWYMLNYSIEYQTELFRRRWTGEYETDEWGFDQEVLQAIIPFFNFLYKTYWRVETTGIINIPCGPDPLGRRHDRDSHL
jgi:hypothetical protein